MFFIRGFGEEGIKKQGERLKMWNKMNKNKVVLR
jgi:hypothetical protein